ncbi:hypothetical protein KBC03_01150 [Patescibacteria group bacterium]|nr:hypothetical protein [Patescibacteria group bacterium]
MIGNLRNRAGNSAIRYGVGREDKSFEIVQYDLANGKTSYVAKIYNNKLFGGKPVESFVINAEHPIRKEIEEMGFLQTAINYLGNYSSM